MTFSNSLLRRSRLRRSVTMALALLAGIAGAVGMSQPAMAVTTSSWATWSPLSGTGGNYSGSVRIAETPSLGATFTSDSRAPAAIPSGASTWLGTDTPVGAIYGSSRNQAYLNLRPRQDSPAAPSVTTYTFDRPTPRSGWTFALGDIDADQVTITATAPDGSQVPAAGLGFRGVFNYCSSCAVKDLPSWDPSTQTLTGNAAAADTDGASAWFEPAAPLQTLTFTFQQRAGFPIYQTWFASVARDITGTVTDHEDAPVADIPIELRDEYGDVVATTATDAGGTYSFAGITAADGYTVSITPPTGMTSDGASLPADLAVTDAVVDFAVRNLRPVSVSGSVSDTDGEPVPGVSVSLGDLSGSQTSASDGSFTFADVDPGTYQPEIVVPAGYAVESAPAAFTIQPGSEDAVTGQDFVLAAELTPTPTPTPTGGIQGLVSGIDGQPVGGGTVQIDGTAVIGASVGNDGRFAVGSLPLGTYHVALTPPDGYIASNATATVEISAAGETVTANFVVTAESDTAGTTPGSAEDPSGTLPDTGGEYPVGFVAAGTALVILGTLMLTSAARRRRACLQPR